MKRVTTNSSKGKKKVLGEVNLITVEEYNAQDFNAKVEMIRQLIPLGLMLIHQTLQEEVKQLVGERYSRDKTNPHLVRYGSNPGSVKVGGQRHPIQVPRVRDRSTQTEVPLSCLQQLKGSGETGERLLKQVLYGISCRNYEAAAESIPGAIGLSPSTVSRSFIQASARQLREFQERDLSSYDIVALFLDGKTFAEDTMVIAMGVTMKGEKVFLGFVQTGTENGAVLSSFLTEMLERGLSIEEGLLVVIDGSKGMRAAIKKVFKNQAVIQRCQWHKRENVLKYLTKSQQAGMRRRLQRAYDKPTYQEAKSALKKILVDLEKLNVSAAASLREGLEETLTLHRLGLFPLVGISLKTTNCLESINRMVEDRCRKVTCWKNASQKHRWLAACLMDIEPRTRRIKGYRHLSKLREKLREEIGIAPVKQAA